MRNTGVVVMDEDRVIAADTIRFKDSIKGWSYKGQQELMHRLHDIKAGVLPYLLIDHDWEVCEGFFTYPGRQNASTFQSAMVTGAIISMLDEDKAVIQTSDQVFNSQTPGAMPYAKALLQKGKSIMAGDELCTNDHERSAFLHGVYFINQRRMHG